MATNFGITSPAVGEHWYEAGTVVPIQAFAPSVIIGERYVWNGWTGTGTISYTGTANPSSVTMNGPITETASWTHQFLLTIKTSGLPSAYPTKVYLGGSQVGTVSDVSPYTQWFNEGTSTGTIGVDSTVSGATGTRYIFVKWVEDSSTSNPRASETMNSPKTFTAEYKTQYYLTVNTDPAGITTISGAGWYDQGLTATTGTAPTTVTSGSIMYKFTTWKKDGIPVAGNPVSVLMDAPHTATACYEKVPTAVGGYAEFVTEVYSPASELSFTKVLALITLAFALIIATTFLKCKNFPSKRTNNYT